MRTKINENVDQVTGTTSEGRLFTMNLRYAPGAPTGASPIRIYGMYGARDGGGEFDVEKWNDLPAVITEGEW